MQDRETARDRSPWSRLGPLAWGSAVVVASLGATTGTATVTSPPQEPTVESPSSQASAAAPDLRGHALRPFEARYSQVGTDFDVRLLSVPGDGRPQLAMVMTMPSPAGGLAVDHVGLWADDLSFAYRRFAFGRWGPEYLRVSESDGMVTMLRMSLDPDADDGRRVVREALQAPAYDGTVVYWLLAALPLEEGLQATLPTLSWTREAFAVTDTAFEVVGREPVELGNDVWDCWVVRAGNDRVEIRSWVSPRPPYLLKQEMTQGDQHVVALELKELISTS